MQIKLILFDLDGTLVDSKTDIANALNYALSPLGVPKLSDEDTMRVVGDGITQLFEKLIGNTTIEIRDSAIAVFSEYYLAHITEYTKPYPGVLETLKELSNYKKAVISNKREQMSKLIIKELGIEPYIDLLLGGDSVPEKKPSPIPLQMAMDFFNVIPEQTIMIGDSSNDINAGISAGVKTIAVTYGFRSIDTLQSADYFIYKDMRELISILRGQIGAIAPNPMNSLRDF
ncbi:MAG: HAD-IA family hydrolase [Nitrospirae bacterium]|nr:HAD-IA family hydrolase [Nitrospirota bacterium]MBF0541977.1 HAD-IA family hydrolase [Nitrospirota bacterium]